MPLSDATLLGKITAQVDNLEGDVRELRQQREGEDRRLRDVETAVKLMIQAQQDARRLEEKQYRRLEVRLQVLTIIAAAAGVASPIALVLLHH